MGAPPPRPCPEAEIAIAMVKAATNPNLDIAFVMAV
jgi:hypothetical protein